jgi:glycosyltransferase involved in cell wall biosynthesis
VVFAGNFTAEEVSAMEEPPLEGVVRWLGRLSHSQALGLQRAADGLLFLATPGASSVTTGKVYEYLATGKPILAFAAGTDAQQLLERGNGHVIRSASDSAALEGGLRSYLDVWLGSNGRTVERPPLDELDVRPVARRLAELFAELGVLEREA